MELPELPEGEVDTPMLNEAWTREQMLAYGGQCILLERERAACIAEHGYKYHPDDMTERIAAAIRKG